MSRKMLTCSSSTRRVDRCPRCFSTKHADGLVDAYRAAFRSARDVRARSNQKRRAASLLGSGGAALGSKTRRGSSAARGLDAGGTAPPRADLAVVSRARRADASVSLARRLARAAATSRSQVNTKY